MIEITCGIAGDTEVLPSPQPSFGRALVTNVEPECANDSPLRNPSHSASAFRTDQRLGGLRFGTERPKITGKSRLICVPAQ